MNSWVVSTAEAKAVRASPANPLVFVVDDDISVRESLELLIQSAGYTVESFRSAEEFMRRERPAVPNCLILDVNLPGLFGLELQQRMASKGCRMPIIFITAYGDVQMTVRAMKAGAVEFLTKPLSESRVLGAVEEALNISDAAMADELGRRELRECYEMLSLRERQVMACVVRGMLNKQIAGELDISEVTVKAHRGRMMRKMHAHSVPDLVNMAARLRSVPEKDGAPIQGRR